MALFLACGRLCAVEQTSCPQRHPRKPRFAGQALVQRRVVPSWKVDADIRASGAFPEQHAPHAAASAGIPGPLPDYKVLGKSGPEQMLLPSAAATDFLSVPSDTLFVPAAQSSKESNVGNYGGSPYQSTPDQDRQQCATISLPQEFYMLSDDLSVWKQSGTWVDGDGLHLAFWMRNLFSFHWRTVFLSSPSSVMAVKAPVETEAVLHQDYRFWVSQLPTDYPALKPYETRTVRNAGTSMGTTLGDATVVPFLDCAGELLFVAAYYKGEGPYQSGDPMWPGFVDVYDRDGNLVAHSLDKVHTLRFQFVDTNGHLLATVESPGVGHNISKEHLQRDAGRGNVVPYQIRYEPGGYANSSRLLAPEFRWVLAQAAQVRALFEAAEYTAQNGAQAGSWDHFRTQLGITVKTVNGYRPNAQLLRAICRWAIIAFAGFLLFLGCVCSYQAVFPSEARRKPDTSSARHPWTLREYSLRSSRTPRTTSQAAIDR